MKDKYWSPLLEFDLKIFFSFSNGLHWITLTQNVKKDLSNEKAKLINQIAECW